MKTTVPEGTKEVVFDKEATNKFYNVEQESGNESVAGGVAGGRDA